MAELKDVVGAVLKDVAHSRVISDYFSAEVSGEYEKDPILSVFPVPRVEIKETSINLKFAVDAVQKRPIDLTGPARSLAGRYSAELAAEVFRDLIENHPNASAILRSIESRNLNLRQRIEAAAGAAILGDQPALDAARLGKPEALAKRVRREVSVVLMEDPEIKRLLVTRGFRVGTINETLMGKANVLASRFSAAFAAAAVAAADRQSFAIHVGVTRKELDGTPESLVSQISIVAQIRNYEWVEVGEANGVPVKRLRPE